MVVLFFVALATLFFWWYCAEEESPLVQAEVSEQDALKMRTRRLRDVTWCLLQLRW